ncbi:MAG: diacylglycerol/lipid kinase family protein [Candidatus Sericytochromatia bacterium]
MAQAARCYHLIVPAMRQSRALEQAIAQLRGQGLHLEAHITRDEAESRACIVNLAPRIQDTLVVAGGDGLLRLVASELLALPQPELPSLGILPLGTANDFALCQGLPMGQPAAALSLMATSPARPIDVGRVNGACFVNISTSGFVSEIAQETSMALKQRLGKQAYALTTLRKLFGMRPHWAHLRSADWEWEGLCYALIVGNSRMAGGGLEICPQARLDDGLLDLTLVTQAPRWHQIPQVFGRLLQAGVAGLPEYVHLQRFHELEVRLKAPLSLEGDGDPMPRATHIRYDLNPRPLWIHLPASQNQT